MPSKSELEWELNKIKMASESDMRKVKQIHALANKLNEVIEKLNIITKYVTNMHYPHGDKMVEKVDIYDMD